MHIWHTNITARLLKKRFIPARSMPANIELKEMCGGGEGLFIYF